MADAEGVAMEDDATKSSYTCKINGRGTAMPNRSAGLPRDGEATRRWLMPGPEVLELLNSLNLGEWAVPLREGLSMVSVEDLHCLEQEDLAKIGMESKEERQRLLDAAAAKWLEGGGVGTRKWLDHLTQVVYGAHVAASAALATAMEELGQAAAHATDMESGQATAEVYQCLTWAKFLVDGSECAPEMAAKALLASSRALASTWKGSLNESIRLAETAVMEFLIWCAQLKAPLGNKAEFKKALHSAGGWDIPHSMFLRLMECHRRVMANKFPGAAFPSNRAGERRRGNEAPVPQEPTAFGVEPTQYLGDGGLAAGSVFDGPLQRTVPSSSPLVPTGSTASSSSQCTMEAHQAALLAELTLKAASVAGNELQAVFDALQAVGCDNAFVFSGVIQAQWAVVDPECTPQMAARALTTCSDVLLVCPPGMLDKALKALRDFLVWKTQLRTPLGSRAVFVAALIKAVGQTEWNMKLYSQLMHSHEHTVAKWFPDGFLTNAKHEAVKRKGKRPARGTRTRETEEEGSELSEEEEREQDGQAPEVTGIESAGENTPPPSELRPGDIGAPPGLAPPPGLVRTLATGRARFARGDGADSPRSQAQIWADARAVAESLFSAAGLLEQAGQQPP